MPSRQRWRGDAIPSPALFASDEDPPDRTDPMARLALRICVVVIVVGTVALLVGYYFEMWGP